MNENIRAAEIRVIGPEGEQVGVLSIGDALRMAEEAGMDLVEVSPEAKPPVARIMDFGKYRFEQTKKQKKNKKNVVHLKEIQFRPKTDEHDYEFKVRHIRDFLEKGHRVKVGVFFRGREMSFVDQGRAILDRVLLELSEIAKIEKDVEHTGRLMMMVLAPKK